MTGRMFHIWPNDSWLNIKQKIVLNFCSGKNMSANVWVSNNKVSIRLQIWQYILWHWAPATRFKTKSFGAWKILSATNNYNAQNKLK